MRKYIEQAVAVGLLVLLVGALSWPYVGGQALPLDLSMAQTLAPWQSPEAGAALPSQLSERHVYQTYAAYQHLATIPKLGDGLLWNPTEALGAPFLAQWHTRAFSPFSLPVYLFGVVPGLGLSALMKLLVAGLAAYYTARRFGLHGTLPVAVAAIFMASPGLYVWSSDPLSDALPWFPLLLLGAERLALGQRYVWPMLALVAGLIALAGHPPALVGALLFVAVYVVLRARGLAPLPRVYRLLPMLPALAVGLALAGVQLLPYLEYLGQSVHAEPGFQPVTGMAWSAILLPTSVALNGWAQSSALLFPGFLPVLLLPLWWVLRPFMEAPLRTRSDALMLIGFGGIVLSVLLGNWVIKPWFDASIFLLPTALAFAFVAGSVAEEWLALSAKQIQAALPRLTFAVPVVWALWLVALVATMLVTNTPWLALLPAVFTAVAVFALFALTLFRPNVTTLAVGLILIAVLSASWTLSPLKPHTATDALLPQSSFGKALTTGDYARIAGSGALESWPLSLLGMQQCAAPNAAGLKRLDTFSHAVSEHPLLLRRTGANGLLLTKEDIRGAMSDIRPVLRTKAVFEQGAILFEDSAMAARARVIYSGKRTDQPGEAPDGAADLPLLEGAMLPEDGNAEAGAATVDSETASEVRIGVPNTPPGILVLADQWYPGWTATVDGDARPVLPIDTTFRGIEIGEGAHEAVFRYQPASFRYGLMLSAFGLVVLLVGFWRATAERE